MTYTWHHAYNSLFIHYSSTLDSHRSPYQSDRVVHNKALPFCREASRLLDLRGIIRNWKPCQLDSLLQENQQTFTSKISTTTTWESSQSLPSSSLQILLIVTHWIPVLQAGPDFPVCFKRPFYWRVDHETRRELGPKRTNGQGAPEPKVGIISDFLPFTQLAYQMPF